jgi:uncharacterized protein
MKRVALLPLWLYPWLLVSLSLSLSCSPALSRSPAPSGAAARPPAPSGGPAAAPSPSGRPAMAPSPALAPAPAAVDAFFTAIEALDRATVEEMLRREPALAGARGRDGVSAVVTAATRVHGEGFVCTHENPVLRAVLARAPALDVFEAALVGDTRRLAAILDVRPRLVATTHPLGWTALHFAAFGGAREAVALLVARGAAIETRANNAFKNTPLQVAFLCGERQVIELLLARGANPNVRQGEGFHALHEAALLGRLDLIQLLLDHGAEINPRSDGGETPLGTALRKGQARVAAYLRARGAVK